MRKFQEKVEPPSEPTVYISPRIYICYNYCLLNQYVIQQTAEIRTILMFSDHFEQLESETREFYFTFKCQVTLIPTCPVHCSRTEKQEEKEEPQTLLNLHNYMNHERVSEGNAHFFCHGSGIMK